MNRREFQRLATIRLREAKLLLAANAPDGAYYLAGYAVECALKACIAKKTKRHDFPAKDIVLSSYSHELEKLIRVAELALEHEIANLQPDFKKKWKIMAEWKAESRYSTHSMEEAQDLMNAIADRKGGVLRWIKQRW